MQKDLFLQLKKKQKGFTLVELMVSVALFSIVVTVSMGTLITMIDANNKAQALYTVMTNVSFAVDSITRNIRTGNTYYCSEISSSVSSDLFTNQNPRVNDCTNVSNPGNHFIFTREGDGKRTGYRHNRSNNSIDQFVEIRDGVQFWQRITAEDVVINKLEFLTYNTQRPTDIPSDVKQARVSILIEGSVAGQRGSGADFVIQTSVPQQIIDY